MDEDDRLDQGGLVLHSLHSYSCLSSLHSYLMGLINLVVFSLCFARHALEIENHARTPLPLRICAPVHDALLIELSVDELESDLAKAQGLMRLASQAVLGDFELGSDAKVVCYPDRYMDERGQVMWDSVMSLIQKIKGQSPAAASRTT